MKFFSSKGWQKLGQQLWEWRAVWITTPAVAGVVIGMRLAAFLQPLEWAALDVAFRLRPVEPQDDRIVVVGFEETDIAELGSVMSDQTLAKLLNTIKKEKPRAIGLDFYRNVSEPPGHEELLQVFKSTPNLIGIEKMIGDEISAAIPPSPELKQLDQIGANDIVQDPDGVMRRGFLYVKNEETEETRESLGFRVALLFLEAEEILPEAGDDDDETVRLGEVLFSPFGTRNGGYVNVDDASYQTLINYRGPARKSFRIVSVSDVLKNQLEAGWARDRVVMIGPTAASKNDLFKTPFSGNSPTTPELMAGVEIQSHVTSQVISAVLDGRPLIQFWADPMERFWIFLWAGTGAILSWRFRSPLGAVLAMTLAGTVLIVCCLFAFGAGWWLPLVPGVMALTGSAIVITGYIANLERLERQTVMNLFGRHVTPEIAETIWQNREQFMKEGRLRGQRVSATVLFTDLKGFSSITERIDAETLMLWLNEYMDAMSQLVLDHSGVVDKFIGDAVMAVFGVPISRTTEAEVAEDAQRAVECALKMGATLKDLNEQWKERNLPIAAMRVGISTGDVVTGSLGGKNRADYTTIGDTVNVASRLESFDKTMDGGICRILVSEETHSYLQDKFISKLVGTTQLKGKAQATRIYQILGEKSSSDL